MPLDAAILDPPVDRHSLKPMIAPLRTALLVIDAQVDFIAPDGAMGQAGLDLSPVGPVLRRIDALIAAARAAAVAVVFLRVVTRPETDSEALKLLMQRKGYPLEAAAICRAGTVGADYYGVEPQAGDLEIEKALFSGFSGTSLSRDLRDRGLDTLVVTGFTTECCVDCTVRDAFHQNFNVFVVQDGCAAYSEDLHYGALNGLVKNCALLAEAQSVVDCWSPVAA